MKKLTIIFCMLWAASSFAQYEEYEKDLQKLPLFERLSKFTSDEPDSLIAIHKEALIAFDTASQRSAEKLLYIHCYVGGLLTYAQKYTLSDSILFKAQEVYLEHNFDTVNFSYGFVYDRMSNNSTYTDDKRSYYDTRKRVKIWSQLNDPNILAANLIELVNTMPLHESMDYKLMMLDSAINVCDKHKFYSFKGVALALKGLYISYYDPFFGKELLIESLDAMDKVENPNLNYMAVIYGMLGSCYNGLSKDYKDEQFYWYTKNEEIFTKKGFKMPPRQLEMYLNWFDAYLEYKDMEGAKRCLDSVANIFANDLDSTHYYYGHFQYREGVWNIMNKKWDDAKKDLKYSLKNFLKREDLEWAQNARNQLARVAFEEGKPDDALVYLNEIIFTSLNQEIPDNPLLAPVLNEIEGQDISIIPQTIKNKILVFKKRYEKEPSEELLNAITEHYKFLIDYRERIMVSSMSMEASMIEMSKILDSYTHDILKFYSEINLSGRTAREVWELVSANKASQLYIAKLKMKAAPSESPESKKIQKLNQEVQQLISDLQNVKDNTSEEYKAKRKEWLSKSQKLLVMQNNSQENTEEATIHKLAKVNLATLQEIISDKDLVMDYYLQDTNVYCFQIDKQGVLLHSSAHNETIPEKVKQAFKSIKQGSNISDELNNELSEMLLKNTASKIKDVNKIIVLPDKELHLLPFDLLKAGNKLLIEQVDIAYNYSAPLLRESIKADTIQNRNLLVMSPGFLKGDEMLLAEASPFRDFPSDNFEEIFEANQANKLAPLPYSVKEANAINKIFKKNKVESLLKIKEEASEDAFLQSANKFGILHFATHGIAVKSQPNKTGIFFSQEATGKGDGFLQMNELYNLNLNASLVVLSACKTGYGSITDGEGIMAIPRGFIFAGVKNVMASLWKVHDKHTMQLMIDFYENLLNGSTYANALRKAKLKAIKQGNLPIDWSGFILIGH